MLVKMETQAAGGSSKNTYYVGYTRSAVFIVTNNDGIVYNTQGNGYYAAINNADINGDFSVTTVASSDNYTLKFNKSCKVTTITGTEGTEATTNYSANDSANITMNSVSLFIEFD